MGRWTIEIQYAFIRQIKPEKGAFLPLHCCLIKRPFYKSLFVGDAEYFIVQPYRAISIRQLRVDTKSPVMVGNWNGKNEGLFRICPNGTLAFGIAKSPDSSMRMARSLSTTLVGATFS